MRCKGPTNDADRINYDLSILINHISDYEKYLARSRVEETNKQTQKETTKINYNSVANRSETKYEGLDDISDMLDEFF